MTTHSLDSLRGTMMGSANYSFKAKYMRTLEVALLIAGALHVVAFLTVPPIEIQPYRLKEEQMQAIDIPEDITIPPPPEDIERPVLPTELEISDDVSMEETISITEFNPFAPPAIPEESGVGSEGFVAFDSPPVPIKREAPAYPEMARTAGAEGTVMVEVTIDKNGRVVEARVIKSDTIPALEAAAVAAAKQWLFTPAKQREVPVKAKIVIPFEFTLRG
jgi:protein TonB